MDTKERTDKKVVLYIIAVAGALFLRAGLSGRITAFFRPYAVYDDQWMVYRAASILAGRWLGRYDQYTLMKGLFSPLLLAFSRGIGLTFLSMNTLLYCGACLYFICAIRPLVKNRFVRFVLLLVLLFNPLSYAAETWQRVYRNMLIQWELPLIFGSVAALFIRRGENTRKLLPWAVMGGFSVWAYLNTVEKTVWLWPFLLCAALVTVVVNRAENREEKEENLSWKACVFVMPVILALMGNFLVRTINFVYYGSFLRTDLNKGNYSLVIKDIYKIRPDENDRSDLYEDGIGQKFNVVSPSTLEKAYTASPTLRSMRKEIDAAVAAWGEDDTVEDSELYADAMVYALREGVAKTDFYNDNLPETEALFAQIHKELKSAFRSGQLEKRGGVFSAIAAPFYAGDLPNILRGSYKALRSMLQFKGVSTKVYSVPNRTDWLVEFERVSGSRAIIQSETYFFVKGWAFAVDSDIELKGALFTQENELVTEIGFNPGEDVYASFLEAGSDYPNAHESRFQVELNDHTASDGLILRFFDQNGLMLYESELGDVTTGESIFTGDMYILLDKITDISPAFERELNSVQFHADKANRITHLYQAAGKLVSLLALAGYLGLCILMIVFWRRWDAELSAAWLLATGLLLSMGLFVFSVAYTTATSGLKAEYPYLGAGYIMDLMFCVVVWIYWRMNGTGLLRRGPAGKTESAEASSAEGAE